MWNADESKCPFACFRPVGLAMARDGEKLFVTSDATGELFVVTGFKGQYEPSRARPKIESEDYERPHAKPKSGGGYRPYG